jgi:hypothetical protein
MRATAKAVAAAMVLAVSTALVVVAAGPAAAITTWTFRDSFENSTWTTDGVGGWGYVGYSSTAHSGTQEAFVDAWNGWGSVGRPVRIGVPAGGFSGCVMALWVRPLEPVTRLNVEVINPSTWNYVALRTVTLTAPAPGVFRPYQYVYLGESWTVSVRDVFFRVSAVSHSGGDSTADVDDVEIRCSSRA